jgi:phage replication initiation protein
MRAAPRVDLSDQTPCAQAETHPPATNRGVERTDSLGGRALIDWVAYTVPEDVPLGDALPGGDELDWTPLEKGGLGYQNCAIAGHARVYYNGQPGMGKHVSLPGQACRELEASGALERDDVGGWPGFLGQLRSKGYHITRLDVALDDRDGQLDIGTMREAAEAGHYTSPWQAFEIVRSRKRRGEDFGDTLYFGSPRSDVHLRVYDKAAERSAKGESVEGSWTRVELQAKDKHAEAIAGLLAAACCLSQQ